VLLVPTYTVAAEDIPEPIIEKQMKQSDRPIRKNDILLKMWSLFWVFEIVSFLEEAVFNEMKQLLTNKAINNT
jgi:hypothetical protein